MKGRPVLGVVSGLFFGVFLAVTLILAGKLPLNSVLVTLMPIFGIAVGLLLAVVAPLGRRSGSGGA
jgi:hypothetical protein